MLNCPMCMSTAGIVNTELTELDINANRDGHMVERIMVCSSGHEFAVYYTLIQS